VKNSLFLLVLLPAVLVAGKSDHHKTHFKFPAVPGEETIPFDREYMNEVENWFEEGPILMLSSQPWPGQEAFLKKLWEIEDAKKKAQGINISLTADSGDDTNKPYDFQVAPSYWDTNDIHPHAGVRVSYFADPANHIRWTNIFGQYYVARLNVKPSREFYRYVMNYRLPLAGPISFTFKIGG